MPFALTNTDNVTDAGLLELDLAVSVTTAVVGGNTYLFVAGFSDDGVSVFSVANNGTLANVDNVTDAGALELDGARAVTTAVVGGTTFLFVTGSADDGVSVFSVANNGALTNVDNVTDAGALELNDPRSATTAEVGGTTYLFVGGLTDDGVSVFSVANNGALTNVDNVTDAGALELDGVRSVTAAVVGGTTYLFVAGQNDDGVSVFSVANNGTLTNVDNVTDAGALELDGAVSVSTAEVGGTTYLFVASEFDDGVSVFSVANNGSLTNVDNVADAGALELDGAFSVATAVVGGTTYLFVAGLNDDGVSVFSVANNGTLTNVANVTDGGTLELDGAGAVTAAVVDGTTYLFASGQVDNGVSVFSVTAPPFTAGDDVVDLNLIDLSLLTIPEATDALAGDDTVILSDSQNIGVAFDGNTGNDSITGSASGDSISGGLGDDTLDGGGGVDSIDGGADDDTLVIDNGLNANEVLDGGGDTDRLQLTASGTFNLNQATVTSIEEIEFATSGDSFVNISPSQVGAGLSSALAVTGSGNADHLELIPVAINPTLDLSGWTFTGWNPAGGDSITYYGVGASDIVTGSSQADDLRGFNGTDTLSGGGGNDTINGGAGNDQLTGGAGADVFVLEDINPFVAQTDVITDFNVAEDQIRFGGFGPASWEMLQAGMLREDGSGNAQLRAPIAGNLQTVTLTGVAVGTLTAANFIFDTSGTSRNLASLPGDSYLFGGLGDDTLTGASGNDVFLGDTGADSITGGTGNDRYFVDHPGDVVVESAGEGTDSIYAFVDYALTPGQSIEFLRVSTTTGLSLTGNDFAGNLYGNIGNDSLTGGAMRDIINGGAGADSMTGLGGNDTYFVDNAGDVVVEAVGGGTDNVYASVNYSLSAGQEIESLRANGGSGAIMLTGNEFANTIVGEISNDTLNGGLGNDTLFGGDGNDTLNGGDGIDRLFGNAGTNELHGNAGDDIYYITSASDLVFEAAGEGSETVYAFVSYALQAGQEIELLRANAGATGLELTGNNLDNHLFGNTGNDTLNGGDGGDILNGWIGADVMFGNAGNDRYFVDNAGDQVFEAAGEGTADTVYANLNYTLAAGQEIEQLRANAGATGLQLTGNELANFVVGAGGNDTLDGGNGVSVSDILIGGGGADTFHFPANWGTDRITDFEDGTDQIAIDGLTLFSELTITQAGSSALVEFGADSIILFNTTATNLQADDFGL